MALKTLEENINQAKADFKAIKAKIVENGVDIPKGTPTSEYPSKVDEAVQKGKEEIAQDTSEAIAEQSNRLEECLNGDSTEGDALYDAIYSEGHEAGKKAEYDEFWDSIPYNVSPSYLFSGRAWTNKTFKPNKTYELYGNASGIFYNNAFKGDFVELCEKQDITFSFSRCTGCSNLFAYSSFTRLGVIDLSNSTDASNVFLNMYSIHTIDKIILKKTTSVYRWFDYVKTLKNITFEGEIGGNSLNFSWSKELSKESITSIINALSSTTTGLTVTISLTAVTNAFTDDEWTNLTATKPNWTISLIDS